MSKITINSELDLYEKGGNSTHARWIADKFLKARQLGIISDVELAILDTSLANDFGSFRAYQEGANITVKLSPPPFPVQFSASMSDVVNDNFDLPKKVLASQIFTESTRDRCRREMKDVRGDYPSNHFDSHQSW